MNVVKNYKFVFSILILLYCHKDEIANYSY